MKKLPSKRLREKRSAEAEEKKRTVEVKKRDGLRGRGGDDEDKYSTTCQWPMFILTGVVGLALRDGEQG